MLLITCPWCGPRAQTEFTYGGDAGKARPADPEALSDAEWHEHLYLRDNRKGPHDELWQHSGGCRSLFKARRDTRNHDVLATGPLDADLGDSTPGATGSDET